MSASLFSRIAASRAPDRLAVITPDGSLTHAALVGRARGLAARLGDRRSPIVVYGQKEPAVLVSFLAALRLGRAYVPIDPLLPPGRVERMLDAVGAGDAVLARDAPPPIARVLAARGIATLRVDALAAGCETHDTLDPPPPDPETPAYILFTS